MNKTSYRKAYKSDHLGAVDLDEFVENGSNLVFTIARTEQLHNARIAGKIVDICNVAHFKEPIKPMVVNAGNGKIISKFAGSIFVEEWVNIPIQLYVKRDVRLGKEIVGGIRIKTTQPRISLEIMNQNHKHWQDAINAVKVEGWTIEQMREKYQISEEDYLLCQQ